MGINASRVFSQNGEPTPRKVFVGREGEERDESGPVCWVLVCFLVAILHEFYIGSLVKLSVRLTAPTALDW